MCPQMDYLIFEHVKNEEAQKNKKKRNLINEDSRRKRKKDLFFLSF